MKIEWFAIQPISEKEYDCGYCGRGVAPNKGYWGKSSNSGTTEQWIYICPFCNNPTYFDFQGEQYPGVVFGTDIKHLPKDIESLYNEARRCMKENASTASVLCCRKLLMHIAVSKGAAAGLSFVDYVNFFVDDGHLPKSSKDWVDHIRKKANEANHEIKIMPLADAEELLKFTEMILKIIFEYPETMNKKKIPPSP